MSEGTNVELAHRDLGIEIEKLIEERDRLLRGITHLVEIEDCSQVDCGQCAEAFSTYEEAVRSGK
jgi:hypothetical protein